MLSGSAEPLKILHLLVSTAIGGGPKHVFDLIRRLPREEFDTVVAAPADGPYFDRLRGLEVEVAALPLNRLHPGTLAAVVRLVRARGIRVIHSHGKGAGLYGRLAAWWTGTPALHTFHGIHYERYPPFARAFYLALERRLSHLTHTVINVSWGQEAEGLRLRLFTPTQSVVIANGIDVAEADAIVARAPIGKSELGLASDDLVVGCVARFERVKGLEILLEATRLLVPRYPRLRLVLVGDGPQAPKLRRLAHKTGLSDRVLFTGVVEEAPRLFPAWHAYVSPSRKEGLPLALLEAMACELPVVATRVPGHLDVVVAGETGLLAEPDDPVDLAAKTARLLDDPTLRRAMGQAGRARVAKNFSVEGAAREIGRLYRRAADSGPDNQPLSSASGPRV